MPVLNIICVICGAEIEESKYTIHMGKLHSEGQLAGLAAKKNIPPQINPADLPDPTFLETVKLIEQEAAKEASKPKPQEMGLTPKDSPPLKTPEAEIKPIELTYLYKGNCSKGHELLTIEADADKVHHVIAYCLNCREQVAGREVIKL